ncbi:MAG: hypothetical protein ABIP06_09695 [Pyrinomonadaceae bacterium]
MRVLIITRSLERFSFSLKKMAILVLDIARILHGKQMRERIEA